MNNHLKTKETSETAEQQELNSLLLAEIKPENPAMVNGQAIASRLQARVARSIENHAQLLTVRVKNGFWKNLKKGIRVKSLWNGPEGNSVLIEFAPGAALPVHRHHFLEEGVVLRGDLQMGDLKLTQFDYHVSPSGSRHERIWSKQGALAYLRGTALGNPSAVLRELVGGLLPIKGGIAKTVHATNQDWQELQPGLFRKELFNDGTLASYFYRLEPGASCEAHVHTQHEECMMLSGEIFLGDILLREHDYQFAPKGSYHGLTYTDVGALLFVRSAA